MTGHHTDNRFFPDVTAKAPTVLIITQVYVPDPASVGQHIADVAKEMVRRGWRVVVYTSARGYDDPSQRYPSRESLDGVDVRRLPVGPLSDADLDPVVAVHALDYWLTQQRSRP